jgi:hypothetical protein
VWRRRGMAERIVGGVFIHESVWYFLPSTVTSFWGVPEHA